MIMLHDDGYNHAVALWSILNQQENRTEERHVHTSLHKRGRHSTVELGRVMIYPISSAHSLVISNYKNTHLDLCAASLRLGQWRS